ncbi:unnamed protein product, partial [marine sediment metagenome]
MYGVRVWKSTDTGETWNPTSLSGEITDNHGLHVMEVSPQDGTPKLTAGLSTTSHPLTYSVFLPQQNDLRNFLMSEKCAEMAQLVANLTRKYRFQLAVLLGLTDW